MSQPPTTTSQASSPPSGTVNLAGSAARPNSASATLSFSDVCAAGGATVPTSVDTELSRLVVSPAIVCGVGGGRDTASQGANRHLCMSALSVINAGSTPERVVRNCRCFRDRRGVKGRTRFPQPPIMLQNSPGCSSFRAALPSGGWEPGYGDKFVVFQLQSPEIAPPSTAYQHWESDTRMSASRRARNVTAARPKSCARRSANA